MVATHEGEAGVRRAEREEDELPDPLGLHGGGSARLGWGVGVALPLGLHRRWPPVGLWVRNWEVPRGDWGRRTAASGSAPGVYAGWTAALRMVWWWMPWMVDSSNGPDFWFGCSSPSVFGGYLAKLRIGWIFGYDPNLQTEAHTSGHVKYPAIPNSWVWLFS